MALFARVSPSLAVGIALVAVAVFSVWVVDAYGLEGYSVQLVPGFAAALLAFLIALAWERDREEKRAVKSADELTQQRATEIRRRLETVRKELDANLTSFRDAETPLAEGRVTNPQLLAGAWTASAPALAELVADVKLIADIAFTYDRIEELRWRLRTRTGQGTPNLDHMTSGLVAELIPEAEQLLERISDEIADPSVQPHGIVHPVRLKASISSRSAMTANLSTRRHDNEG